MKLNTCFWFRTANKEKGNWKKKKKEERPLELIQHLFQVSTETESANTSSTNFYNAYSVLVSEYLELIHCLNELNFAYVTAL